MSLILLEGAEVHALVVAELFAAHVAVVLDDFPHVLWRNVLLVGVHEPELALVPVPAK